MGDTCQAFDVGLAAGFDFVSAYAVSKFGLERWMKSLQADVAPLAARHGR